MLGLRIFRVSGPSMTPVLKDGDFVIARQLRPNRRFSTDHFSRNSLSIDDIVVANHPNLGKIVKRVAKVEEDGVWLDGFALSSSDRHSIGKLRLEQIDARVLFCVSENRIRSMATRVKRYKSAE